MKTKGKSGEGATEAPSVEKDILKELRAKLAGSGASGFHLRIMKKVAGGGFSFAGKLDGTTDDIETTLLEDNDSTGWGPGRYRLWAHFNDGRRVPDVPPLDYTIGNPDVETERKGTHGAKGKRLSDIEEEVEVLKKEKERVRLDKELAKIRDEGDAVPPGVFEKIAQMEMEVEQMRREKAELEARHEAKTRDDKLLAKIEDLEKRISEKPRVDPETEALKSRIAQMEQEKRDNERERHMTEINALRTSFQSEMTALKASLSENNKKSTMSEFTPLITAMTPLLTSYLSGSKTAQEQVAEALKTLGASLKDANKLDLPKIIEMATPIIGPLLAQKNDMTGIFNMVGNLVGPLVEAAAQAAANPPAPEDLGGMIQKALGLISKGLEDGKAIASKQAEAANAGARAMLALGAPKKAPPPPAAPPAAKVPPPPPPKPKRPKTAVKEPPRGLPIVRFANKVSKAIASQSEDFDTYIAHAERFLTDEDLRQIVRYNDGAQLASYFASLPEVESEPFSKPYARRWLSKFIVALKGEPAEEPLSEEEAPDEAKVERKPAEQPAPKREPAARTGNDFDYPADSKVERVEVDGMDMPLEFPSAETIAKREEERKTEIAKWSALRDAMAPPAPEPQPQGA